MNVSYLAILVAAVAQFVFGAIWYMPLFGKLWGQIHGFDKLSKKDQAAAQKEMMPMLAIQFAGTVVTTSVLAKLIVMLPLTSPYVLAELVWIGFFVPTQISAVLFGNTAAEWVVKKTLVMAGASFGCLMIAAAILHVLSA